MNNQTIEKETICQCGELHRGHICWLSSMGLLAEVQHLTSNPTTTCEKCGAHANQIHNICFPSLANGEPK